MAVPRAAFALAFLLPLALAGCSSGGDRAGSSDGGGGGASSGGGGSGGSGGMPDLDVGDHWTNHASGGGIDVRTTMEVKGSEQHAGVAAWRIVGTMTSTALGTSSTADSVSWLRKSDLATLETQVTTHVTYSGTTQEQSSTTVFDPPCQGIAWPLSVGKTWTETCKQNTKSGATDQHHETTTTYTVEGTESVTVPAGTFDAFKVKTSNQDTTGYTYLSLKACGVVKTVGKAYGAQSDVSMDLESYDC